MLNEQTKDIVISELVDRVFCGYSAEVTPEIMTGIETRARAMFDAAMVDIYSKLIDSPHDQESRYKIFAEMHPSDDWQEYSADKWRRRFADGMEWAHADYSNRRILQQIDPAHYPADIDGYMIHD